MKFIGLLPVVPDTFMSRFWTTLGHVIYTPTRYDKDSDWGSDEWIKRHRRTWDHENVHIAQYERWRVLFPIMYVGPAVYLLPVLLVALALSAWAGVSWWVPGGLAIACGGLSPLSVGFAWGRWRIEREAYLVQMDYAASLGPDERDSWAEWVSNSLWKDYCFTWPPRWAKRWFVVQAKKRAADAALVVGDVA